MSKNLAAVATVVGYSTKAVFLFIFIVNLLLGYGLAQIWGILNALQIVAFMIYIDVMVPSNVEVFFQFIMDMADFNFISKEEIY